MRLALAILSLVVACVLAWICRNVDVSRLNPCHYCRAPIANPTTDHIGGTSGDELVCDDCQEQGRS